MKSILQSVASLVLSFCILAGSVACTASRPTPAESHPVERTPLTVVEAPAVYTEQMTESYVMRMTALCSEFVFLTEGLVLKETEKQKLTDTLRQTLIPMLTAIPVYPEETEAVLSSAERVLADGGDVDAWFLWFGFYQSNLSTLGSTRAGRLGYAAVTVWLSSREETCRDRYEKYGYAWYLTDAEHYASMKQRLELELGEDGFCAAAEILTFAASSFVGGTSAWGSANGYGLSAGELTAILSRQSAYFVELSITAEQWSLMGELLEEAAPKRPNTTLEAELGVLADEAYFARAIRVMPSLLALYRAIAEQLSAEDTQTIFYSDDETLRLHTVCRLLVACNGELNAFLEAVETYAATASEKEQKILSQRGELSDCQAFLEAAGTADAPALHDAIASCAEVPSAERAEAVRTTLRAYLATKAPYLFYALHGVGKETAHATSQATA